MIQLISKRIRVNHETFIGEKSNALLPDRVPSLAKIAEMFLSGKPIDSSLQRNLSYNDIERNPMLVKGFDLADIPRIVSKVDSTIKDCNEAVEKIKSAKVNAEISNPSVTEPSKVE